MQNLPPGNGHKLRPAIAELYAEEDEVAEWTSPAAKRIKTNMRVNQLPYSATSQKFERNNSFIRLFYEFAENMCREEQRPFNRLFCLANDELVEMWISTVLEEECGSTRPANARKAINAKRLALRLPALPKFSTVSALVKTAKAKHPKTVKKSQVASKKMINSIIDSYKHSPRWWELQFALMTAVGFLCLLRLIEVRQFLHGGVKLVLRNADQISPRIKLRDGSAIYPPLPPINDVVAIRLYCPFRKTTRHHGSWISFTDPKTMTMMLRHLHNLRFLSYHHKLLFPSRNRVAKRFRPVCVWMPTANPFSHKSYVDAMQKALREVCKLPVDVSKMYTGHVLRVSGSNSIRKDTTLSADVNRQLGAWMSLASKEGYDQQSLIEQMQVTQQLHFL